MDTLHRRGTAHRFIQLLVMLACLVSLMGSGAAKARPASAQSPDGGFIWQMQVNIPALNPSAAGELTAQAALTTLDARIGAALAPTGASYDIQPITDASSPAAYRLDLKGGGLDQLRGVLYGELRGEISLTGESTELSVSGAAAPGQVVQLVLDENISTGYAWDTSQLTEQGIQVGEITHDPTPANRVGAAQRITLPLTLPAHPVTIRMSYNRAWEPALQPTARLSIQAETLPAQIDLSDPQRPNGSPEPVFAAGPVQPLATEPLSLPSSFDWRDQGIVTPVKNQGNCGSCWAFGVVGVLESAILKSGGPETNASEQYLINCSGSTPYKYNCTNGGWWDANNYHYNRFISPQTEAGSVAESEVPYTAMNGSCARAYTHEYLLSGWNYIAGYNVATVDQIKQAIYTYGPVGTAVCAGHAWNYYSGGVFDTNETNQCDGGINHAVILVGWDDATSTWTMKNSWGTNWGDHGYMHIRWGTSNIGYATNYVLPSPYSRVSLSGPSEGQILSNQVPTFTWSAPSNPERYHIQVSTSNAFSSPVVDDTTSNLSYAPTEPLNPNAKYYWRVRAESADGSKNGPWSAVRSFKLLPNPPVLAAPLGGVETETLRPKLSWAQSGTYTGFEVQISQDPNFLQITASGTPSSTSFTPSADLPRKTLFYWQVRTTGIYGKSAWAGPERFTTPDPPLAPTLVSPLGGALYKIDAHPTFKWKAPVVMPAGYRIEFSHTSEFTDVAFFAEVDAAATSYLFSGSFDQNSLYYWRVRSYNNSTTRLYSKPTTARSFKVVPEVPNPKEPINITTDRLRPQFTWDAVGGNPRYDIQISASQVCGTVLRSATVASASYTPTSDLPKLKNLYWRVRTRGTYGLSGWSGCQPFATPNPPGIPALLAPLNGGTLLLSTPFQPSFKWKAAANEPSGYELELATNNKFTGATLVKVDGGTNTGYPWTSDLTTGTYYWHVRSYREGSPTLYSSWSAARVFRTPASIEITLTEPALNTVVTGATVTIRYTTLTATTDGSGQYLFPAAPAGSRTLVITAPGYITTTKSLTVTAGRVITVNIAMRKLSLKAALDANLLPRQENQYRNR